ncbi:hypothetical protein CRG98_025255 [Punica granatum]|uniref:Uncharacterized protein n=1 Tax=Punica granatum TaxID=22663 RepID=A0A2I0JDN8_PUNGR|nr:hypothetical protein CRG98_025255 [Punica granatum]
MAEAFNIVHKKNQRMRMEFWDVLSDHSRELALFVLAKDNEIHQELGPVLCSSPAAVLIISHVIVMMLNCSAKDDDEEIVACLLKTKLFPVVLHCPERGHGYTDCESSNLFNISFSILLNFFGMDDLTIAEWARQVRVNVAHGHYYRPIVTDKHPEALRQSFAAMLELER